MTTDLELEVFNDRDDDQPSTRTKLRAVMAEYLGSVTEYKESQAELTKLARIGAQVKNALKRGGKQLLSLLDD